MVRRRVLVVDDDAMIRHALEVVVSEEHDVTVVASVRAARAAIEATAFDVILCDLQLGDGGARDVCAAFAHGRARGAHGFVVMTGGAYADADLPFLRGAPYVLCKPFDFDEALALLEQLGRE